MLIVALFCYLGLYAWNARTGYLDTVAERTGLEAISYVLSPASWVKQQGMQYWNTYVNLTDTAKQNQELQMQLQYTEQQLAKATEDQAELQRLRKILGIRTLAENPGTGARIIAGRFGPHAALKSLTVDKGFADGIIVGSAVVSPKGLVGRIHRTAPHAATVLLISDPSFRVAVISQNTRVSGILRGTPGNTDSLEVSYIPQTATLYEGEVLITAGTDRSFPKGIPVAIVTKVAPGGESLFQQVRAKPLVTFSQLEEVALLYPADNLPPLLEKANTGIDKEHPLYPLDDGTVLPVSPDQLIQGDTPPEEGTSTVPPTPHRSNNTEPAQVQIPMTPANSTVTPQPPQNQPQHNNTTTPSLRQVPRQTPTPAAPATPTPAAPATPTPVTQPPVLQLERYSNTIYPIWQPHMPDPTQNTALSVYHFADALNPAYLTRLAL